MYIHDPIGDLLTRIRNAHMRHKRDTMVPASKMRARLLDVLLEEGYIRGYDKEEHEGRPFYRIALKYYESMPVIRQIQRVSKPGRRVYRGATAIETVNNGLGISIVSTSQGVMSDRQARRKNLGGEVLCKVY